MKHKNPFCVSGALMKEILRMYWYIPTVAFVLYFFTGIIPILSNISNTNSIDYYIHESLRHMNLIYTFIMCAAPLLTAVLMMSFLHKESKALMIHIQPLSKNRIFNSYYISGWLMCVTPILLTAGLYILLAFRIEELTRFDVAFWLFSSIAVTTWFYGITVLAGTLTGTGVMNLLAASVLMVIFPLLMSVASAYCSVFMSGYYKMPEGLTYAAENYNPVLNMLFRYENESITAFVVYFIIGVAVSVLGRLIYKTRKLERIGNTTLSKVFEEIMTYLVVFVGMSAFGLLMRTFSSSEALVVFGMIIGMLLTFLIVKIIVNRSVKILNRDFVRSLAVYIVIAAVFMALTIFDITGFSKRVPEINEVKSVEMRGVASLYDSFADYRFIAEENLNSDRQFKSEESIEKIVKLHSYIIDEELYQPEAAEGAEVYDLDGKPVGIGNEYIHIKYNLENGRTLERMYDVSMNQEVAEMLDEIFTGEEYREKSRLSSYINMKKIDYIQITGLTEEYYDSYYDTDEYYEKSYHSQGEEGYVETVTNNVSMAVVENPKLIREIFAAWDKDMEKSGYVTGNRMTSELQEVASVEIFFKKSEIKKKKGKRKYTEDSMSFIVSSYDENTIDCLTKAGYGYIVSKKPE